MKIQIFIKVIIYITKQNYHFIIPFNSRKRIVCDVLDDYLVAITVRGFSGNNVILLKCVFVCLFTYLVCKYMYLHNIDLMWLQYRILIVQVIDFHTSLTHTRNVYLAENAANTRYIALCEQFFFFRFPFSWFRFMSFVAVTFASSSLPVWSHRRVWRMLVNCGPFY